MSSEFQNRSSDASIVSISVDEPSRYLIRQDGSIAFHDGYCTHKIDRIDQWDPSGIRCIGGH